MQMLILFLVAAVISSVGFKKFIWFISLGYGFSAAGIGLALLVLFRANLTPCTTIMCILFMVYGFRLGGYLLLREKKSASYKNIMATEVDDGSRMKLSLKMIIWLSCAFLYVCETSPVLFRLKNGCIDNASAWIGMIVMLSGIILESFSDFTKNRFKQKYPKRFCDVGVFRMVRCPNYFGEILTWTGGVPIRLWRLEWCTAVDGGGRRLDLYRIYHVWRRAAAGAQTE